MSRRSANKETTGKTAAVSEAMPQRAPKNIRPNAPDKGRVVTKRHKRVVLFVITFINSITFLNLDSLLLFSVWSNQ